MHVRRQLRVRSAETEISSSVRLALANEAHNWLRSNGFPNQNLELKPWNENQLGCYLTKPVQAGEEVLNVPENFAITSLDALNDPTLAPVAKGRGDLTCLTLWHMSERSKRSTSAYAPLIRALPEKVVLSPLTWNLEERNELLKGCSVLEEINERVKNLEATYHDLKVGHFDKSPETFPEQFFSLESFLNSFSVILSRSFYLPSADLFALVPFADYLNHSFSPNASLDFDSKKQAVISLSLTPLQAGDQIFVSYGSERTSGDLFMSYGFVEKNEAFSYIPFEVSLVPADPLFGIKKQLLTEVGFSERQIFPLFKDKFPMQLLAYSRLSRVQDATLFLKLSFDRDTILSESNEYESLQILMSLVRDKIAAFASGRDEDLQTVNRMETSPKEKVAAQMRLTEKFILDNTLTAIRNRLAPIRGIPTKSGNMQDPNQDIKEVFEMMEAGLSAPRKFLSNLWDKK